MVTEKEEKKGVGMTYWVCREYGIGGQRGGVFRWVCGEKGERRCCYDKGC